MSAPEARVAPPERRHPRAGPWWRRPALVALTTYAAVRAVGLLAVWLAAHRLHRSTLGLVTKSDGLYYLEIAQHGYSGAVATPSGTPTLGNPAFHPLFAALISLVYRALNISPGVAGLLVSAVCGLAAAYAIYRVGAHVYDPRTGIVLVALWAALPHAIVESLVYAENLFTALAAWALLAVLRRQWLVAGLSCLLAGLTRPSASALIVAVGIAAVVAIVRREGRWRPLLGAALAPLGLVAYWGWVGHRLGRVDGYFWLQQHVWGTHWDGGRYTWDWLFEVLTKETALPFVVSSVVLFAAVLAAVLLVTDRRIPWVLTVYAITLLVVVIGTSGYYHAKARLLLPAFPLLLPAAAALARATRMHRAAVLMAAALGSAWYGTYLLTVWRFSP
ncbi:MAG: glycosyltransferase family 39 protein [Actinomycetota bacterium]|nr:glycosyltransferase family 39 protein [Actinomycetota bacterium]